MVESTQEEQKIDTNLYSRQIGTFGLEAMGKLMKLKVLIIGCRGLGVETAKNLILAGPKSVTLYDPTTVAVGDLSANFYLKQADVGNKSRAEATQPQLAELNPYVDVTVTPTFTDDDISKYSVICVTENLIGLQKLIDLNEKARAAKVGFILAETLGAMVYTFVDYGNHVIFDADGEHTKQFIISNITQEEKPTVTVHEDKRHSYKDGDHVVFREVEGMTQLNDAQPVEIFDCRAYDFKLKLDTRQFGAYVRQGVVEDKKVPKQVEYKSLAETIKNPASCTQYGMLEMPDLKLWGRSEQLHLAIYAVHAFRDENGRYPENNDADLTKVVATAKDLAKSLKENQQHTVEEVEEEVVKNTAAYCTSSLTSMSAFLGGFVAQEIVKYTGKYTPLKQWFHYDVFESLPDGPVDRTPQNCRYDDQIKVYGRETQEKLGKINTFMIGAGALGCEYLKAFALMGLGCGQGGKVCVTDNDNIEVSNLNRQFLFRKQHVGKSKSECASASAKDMNPDFNVTAYTSLVAPNTEGLFNDAFWESRDFIVNAVDNIKARLYVDR